MICDLAETYHILNYRELSPYLVAVLVLGLKDDSRVKKKLSDSKLSIEQMLLSMLVDNMNFLAWTKTKDAKRGGRFKQKSVLKTLQGEYQKAKDELMSFKTIEEYEEYMKQFIKE